jgi:CRP-like cAMP-binding protein
MASMLKYCFGLPEVAYDAGSNLIVEGKGRGPLFILVEGRVSVSRNDTEVAQINTPGAIFGEISALLDVPHTATVKALSNVRVHVIEQANQFLESRPQIALQVSVLLARRLFDATTYLVDARQKLAGGNANARDVTTAVEAIVYGRGDNAG